MKEAIRGHQEAITCNQSSTYEITCNQSSTYEITGNQSSNYEITGTKLDLRDHGQSKLDLRDHGQSKLDLRDHGHKARLKRSRAIKAWLTRRPRERRESAARRTSHTPAPSASLWELPSDRDASVAACRAPPSHRQGTGRGNAGWSVSRVRRCAAEPSQGAGRGNANVGWAQVSGGTQRPFESTGANQRQLLSTIDGSTG